MAIGYFADLPAANSYFANERLENTLWANNIPLRQRAIITAYNRIYYDPRFILPTYAEATSADLVILSKANAEMAYYLLQHQEDEDRRKGIQVQGVVNAGIVKEAYNAADLFTLPIPPFVLALLEPWKKAKEFAVVEINRDEELLADEDAT